MLLVDDFLITNAKKSESLGIFVWELKSYVKLVK